MARINGGRRSGGGGGRTMMKIEKISKKERDASIIGRFILGKIELDTNKVTGTMVGYNVTWQAKTKYK